MNISALETNAMYKEYISAQIRNDKNFMFSDTLTEANEKSEVELNLEYYHSLCEEFPDITFRLEDIQAAIDLNGKGQEYLGYNGSFNQVGSDFGGLGQCSIEIDVAVISRMRNDPKYEMAVKSMIKDSKDRFSTYRKEVPEQPYTYVCIEDNNGRPQRSRGHSSTMPATEEEIRQKRREEHSRKLQIDPDKTKDELIDNYLKMLEESEQKRKKLFKEVEKRENKGT